MDDNLHNKNNSVSAIIFAGAVFLIIALVLGVLFLMGGNTTTIIGDSGFDAVQSITCENDNVIYPFFQDDAYKRYLKINMILKDNELETISLIYKIYFDDSSTIERNNNNFRATMNKSFGAYGLRADSLNATYSSLSDAVQLSLYAERDDINDVTSRYLLLDEINGNYEKNDIVKVYNSIGLDCIINEK